MNVLSNIGVFREVVEEDGIIVVFCMVGTQCQGLECKLQRQDGRGLIYTTFLA